MKTNITDKLAMERTKLAEERTHLAYIRTGISLAMGGLFFIGFFDGKQEMYVYIGSICLALGTIFLTYGFYSHNKTKTLINRIINGKKI